MEVHSETSKSTWLLGRGLLPAKQFMNKQPIFRYHIMAGWKRLISSNCLKPFLPGALLMSKHSVQWKERGRRLQK